MNGFAGVTDNGWFAFLSGQSRINEANSCEKGEIFN
jgi:hypothetical protein